MKATLVGGPDSGREVDVDRFTLGLTVEESGCYYRRSDSERSVFEFVPDAGQLARSDAANV